MGPIQKAPIIAKWISGLTERRNFQIRKFYSVGELYTIFVQDIGHLVTIDGFVKVINKMARDEYAYPNFKIREKQTIRKREYSYIFIKDNDIDICSIRRNTKRNCNFDIIHTRATKQTRSSIPQTSSKSSISPAPIPQPTTPAPAPVPQPIPVPVPQPTRTVLQTILIPYPVYHHIPVPVIQTTTAIPVVRTIPVATINNTHNNIFTSNDTTFSIDTRKYVQSVEKLDFQVSPRENVILPWMNAIHLRDDKTFDDQFYRMLLLTAYELGYKSLCCKKQLILADAILKRESYINGFSHPLIKPSTFHKLWVSYERERRFNPTGAANVIDKKRGENRVTYIDRISEKFPSFLHECYRHSTKKHGLSDTAAVICNSMNTYAKEQFPDCEVRSNLKMSKHHFWKFFYLNGGKLRKPVTKPRLTSEQVQQRLIFARKWLDKFSNNDNSKPYIAFLDEKWFYTCSRRKKMKLLPRASFETEEDAFIPKPKLRSRRFPCKVMFMGVICPPVKGKTDGKILLKRVSQRIKSQRQSYHQHFVPVFDINHRLKGGEWRSLYSPEVEDSVRDFLVIIEDTYDMDDDIGADLVLVYNSLQVTKSTGQSKPKLIKLGHDQEDGPVLTNRKIKFKNKEGEVCERALNINDLELRVNPQKGKMVERDITCDSSFMMDHIRMIGKGIRDAHSFLPNDHPIYLFMDNAGGHGKTEIKKQYESILKDEFGIFIEWQVPNSPETNMLDLGVWMALQSLVEKLHLGKVMQSDELTRTVFDSFARISEDIFTRVYERWQHTLRLIISGKGTNEVVEEDRGKEKSLILPTVPDSACRQNYTYEAILGDEEVYRCDDVNDDVVQVIDQGMLLEMAFDET